MLRGPRAERLCGRKALETGLFYKLTLCQPLTWDLGKLRPNEGKEPVMEEEALASDSPEITPLAHPPLLLCWSVLPLAAAQAVPARMSQVFVSLCGLFTRISKGKYFLMSQDSHQCLKTYCWEFGWLF